jgi:hypothetical protein
MNLFLATFVVNVRKCKLAIINNIAKATPAHVNCHENKNATKGTNNYHVRVVILGQLVCQ